VNLPIFFLTDVKPSNILVPLLDGQEHQGQQHRGGPPPLAFHAAKLADFGLAAPVAPRPVARVALPSPFAAGRPLIPPSPFAASGPQTGSSGQGAPASSGPSTPALGGGGGGAGGGSSWRGSQGLGSLLDTHSRASSISAGGKGPPSDDAVHMTQHHVPVLAPPQQQFHRLSVTSSFARPSGGLSSVGHADAGAVADHGTVASAGPSHNGSVTMDPSEGFGVAGTVAYAAPEVLDPGRGPVTPAADVWSLGVVMWECLTGQRPWQGHTSGAIMTAVAIQVREKVELGIDRWCTPACCSVLVLLLVRSGRRLTTTSHTPHSASGPSPACA
jgi:serine/threonine protein kinase